MSRNNRNDRNNEDLYNVSKYTDRELYQILDISNPTDRELEAKILQLINKYTNIQNETGDKLSHFFQDIYSHFFEEAEEAEEEEEEGGWEEEEEEGGEG